MTEVANLSVSINADTKGLESGLARAQQHVSSAGSAIQAAMGAALVGVMAGAAAGFVGVVKGAADFEKQMSAVGAVAGASQSEMKALTAAALQLGKDTSFSAKEAAIGIEELVKAGVSVADVMGGGARAALDLAAAGAISVGDAAEIASNAMNVFSLKGADMAHVADVIAGAANASAIGVNDYKFSLAAAGAIANLVGVSFEDLTTAISLMGQAGIKGSDAGTSLKVMLSNLQPATKAQIKEFTKLGIVTADGANAFFTAEGKAKSMAEIAEILKTNLGSLTQAQKLASLEIMFGQDGYRAAAILMEAGAEGANKMAEAIGKVTAQQVANERLNNLWGSVEKLKGSLETAAIILGGQFTPALKRMADAATEHANTMIDVFEQIPDAIETVKQVLAGEWAPDSSIRPFTNAVGEAAVMLRDTFGPAIKTVGEFITGTLVPGFQKIAAPLAAFSAGFLGAVGAAGLASAAFGLVVAGLGLLLTPLGAVAVAVGLLAAAWTVNFGGIQQKVAELVEIVQRALGGDVAGAFTQFIALVTATAIEIGTQLLIWGQQFVDWIAPMIPPMLAALGLLLVDLGTWITSTALPAITTQLLAWGTAFVAWIAPQIPPLLAAADILLLALGAWITNTALPAIVTQLTAWGAAFVAWVAPQIPGLLAALGVLLAAMVAWQVNTAKTQIETSLKLWALAFTEWVAPAALAMIEALGSLLADLVNWIRNPATSEIKTSLASSWTTAFTEWAASVWPAISAEITGLASKIVQALASLPAELGKLGLAAINAFIQGWTSRIIPMPGLPSFGPGDGGGAPGTQSFTPLRNIETMNTAALYSPGVAASTRTGSVAQVNQMKLGLSNAEALAACGPAALDWFRQQMGRNPDAAEAMRLAKAAGWTAARGMAGPGSFSAAAAAAGIPNRMLNAPSDADIDALARSGQPFAISTGEHYYQVQGGSAAGLNVGASGTVLSGGAATMSAADIRGRGYPIQAAIVPDIPAPKPSPPPPAMPSGAFVGGAAAEKTMPGGFPSQWPGFMNQVDEQLPAYLTNLDTIQGRGAETFISVLDAGVAAGGALVTASTDSLGNVTRIYSDASGVIGATITNAAGLIVNTWGMMGAAVVATFVATNAAVVTDQVATGTRLISEVTNAAGITVERYRETSGAIVTIVTAANGQVIADFARTAAEVAMVADNSKTQLISTTTDAMGQTTEVYREQSGQIVTIVTDAGGKIIQQFNDVATAGKSSASGIDSFKSSLSSIKTPDLSGIVKEFAKITDAAKKAQAAASAVGGVKSGGDKDDEGKSPFAKRHSGGPGDAFTPYLVGREGAEELFIPDRPGNFVPGRVAAGGGSTVVLNLTVQGSLVHERELPALIAQSLGQALRDGLPVG